MSEAITECLKQLAWGAACWSYVRGRDPRIASKLERQPKLLAHMGSNIHWLTWAHVMSETLGTQR